MLIQNSFLLAPNAAAAVLAAETAGADKGAGGAAGDKSAGAAASAAAAGDKDVWFGKIDGLDDDTKTFLGAGKYENPASALKALASAQKLLGGDKLSAPKDGEDISKWEGWDKLGALKTPEDYGKALKRPEMPEGVAYDDEAEKALVAVAVAQRWPKHITQAVLDLGTKMRLDTIGAQDAQAKAELATYGTEAAQAWGSKKKDQEEMARRGARFLGADAATVGAIATELGCTSFSVIKTLAALGAAVGEDGALVGKGANSLGITPEQAQAEIKAQNEDEETQKALTNPEHARHKEVNDRRKLLQQIAHAGRE